MSQKAAATLGPAPARQGDREVATAPSAVAIGAAVAITAAMVVFFMWL